MSDGPDYRSPSYKPCSCGGHCYSGTKEQPCWGQVEAVDEEFTEDDNGNTDSYWVHACKGHRAAQGCYGAYEEEPKS